MRSTQNTQDGPILLDRQAYKLSEAAHTLSVSESSIRRLIKRGRLKPVRDLRHILIPVSEIEKFVSVD